MTECIFQHVVSGDRYLVTYDGDTIIRVDHFETESSVRLTDDADMPAMIAWFQEIEYDDQDRVMFRFIAERSL